MRRLLILLAFWVAFVKVEAQAFLSSPMAANEIKAYTIVNYVDWVINGFLDHNCGSKSYDGHQGTDFTLKSFVDMDEGVGVLAAAEGEVIFVIDTFYDREKVSVISKGLGNYIGIRHDNDYYTYYGHLKKNSARVVLGQRVERGDTLAYVGSSGNSTDPHLHFELWYDSVQLVDPFSGNCGNATNLWVDTFAYESDFRIWESGMSSNILSLNQLREREDLEVCCPFYLEQTDTKPTSYWAQLIGLRQGDVLTTKWYTPSDVLWFEFDTDIDQDWWYYYYWTYINPGDLEEGEWHVSFFLNDVMVDDVPFVVAGSTRILEKIHTGCQNLQEDEIAAREYFDLNGSPIAISSTATQGSRLLIERIRMKDGGTCLQLVLTTN